MLERVGAFPIPNEMIAIVCTFWLRAGEYAWAVDLAPPPPPPASEAGKAEAGPTPMQEASLENLRAMLAESDDDEELSS